MVLHAHATSPASLPLHHPARHRTPNGTQTTLLATSSTALWPAGGATHPSSSNVFMVAAPSSSPARTAVARRCRRANADTFLASNVATPILAESDHCPDPDPIASRPYRLHRLRCSRHRRHRHRHECHQRQRRRQLTPSDLTPSPQAVGGTCPPERLATVSNGSGACPCLEASTLLNCGGTVPALGLRVGGASDATRCWWEVLARLGVSKTGPTVAPTLLEPRRRRDGGRSSAWQRPREERRAQREGRGASGRNRRRAPIPPQSEV